VLEALATGDDVFLCDRVECDRELRPLRSTSWLAPGPGQETFRLAEEAELARYLAAARSIGALFSYMSSLVVRKRAWDAHPPGPRLTGTHYAHVGRLFSSLRAGGTLRHLAAPLVLCRGENDSFARGGVVRRFLIDLDGYLTIAEELGLDAGARAAFLGVMRVEHPWCVYAEIRSRVSSAEEWRAIAAKLLAFGYRRWQVEAVGALGKSRPAMGLARLGWFGLRRLRRALTLRR
jgi:abequosyltransferase